MSTATAPSTAAQRARQRRVLLLQREAVCSRRGSGRLPRGGGWSTRAPMWASSRAHCAFRRRGYIIAPSSSTDDESSSPKRADAVLRARRRRIHLRHRRIIIISFAVSPPSRFTARIVMRHCSTAHILTYESSSRDDMMLLTYMIRLYMLGYILRQQLLALPAIRLSYRHHRESSRLFVTSRRVARAGARMNSIPGRCLPSTRSRTEGQPEADAPRLAVEIAHHAPPGSPPPAQQRRRSRPRARAAPPARLLPPARHSHAIL